MPGRAAKQTHKHNFVAAATPHPSTAAATYLHDVLRVFDLVQRKNCHKKPDDDRKKNIKELLPVLLLIINKRPV
jgi:hypothetical protein